jgi:molecular chaperone Hsp33
LPLEHARGMADEDWAELALVAETLRHEELLQSEPETLLRRLFGDRELRLFQPRPVTVACRCSRAGISRLLLTLGKVEADSIVAEQGCITVACEFCGREYIFGRGDTAELFAAAAITPSNTRH